MKRKLLIVLMILMPFFINCQSVKSRIFDLKSEINQNPSKGIVNLNKYLALYMPIKDRDSIEFFLEDLIQINQSRIEFPIFDLRKALVNFQFKNLKYSSCLNSCKSSIEFFKNKDKYIEVAFFYSKIGDLLLKIKDYSGSLENIKTSQTYCVKGKDANCECNALIQEGKLFNIKGNYKEAINSLEKAEILCSKFNLKANDIKAKKEKADVLFNLGNYETSIQLYLEIINYYKLTGSKNQLSEAYYNLATVFFETKKFESSLNYIDSSIYIFREIEDFDGLARSYTQMGLVNLEKGNLVNAEENFLKCYQIREEHKDLLGLAQAAINLSIFYLDNKDFQKAYFYAEKTYKLSFQILNNNEILESASALLKKIKTYSNNLYDFENIINSQRKLVDSLKNESIERENISLALEKASFEEKESKQKFEFQKIKYQIESREKDKIIALEKIKNKTESELAEKVYLLNFNKLKTRSDSLRAANKESVIREKAAQELVTLEINKRETEKIYFIIFTCLLGFSIIVLSLSYYLKRRDNKLLIEEKKRSDNLLLNILPSSIAKELKLNGHSPSRQIESVSVIFTDFVDFTKLSSSISSTELIEELNFCFSEFDKIIARYGIEKIKTIGDAYMAVAGVPNKIENHAECAINAAIEINEFMRERKIKLNGRIDKIVDLRIGIHSGPVVAGIVGINKFQYDIWGDTVNLANRMEKASETGKINISASTYNLVVDKFDYTYRGKINVKGKGDVDMYYVS